MVSGICGSTALSTDMMAQMRERMFERLDSDGDGQIDLSEVQSQAQKDGVDQTRLSDLLQRLTEADVNGDGLVSREEFEAMKMPPPPSEKGKGEDMFSRLDPDGDGQINLSEIQAKAGKESDSTPLNDLLKALLAADTDGDGMVSREEFKAMELPPPPDDMQGQRPQLEGMTYSFDGSTAQTADPSGALLNLLG